MIRQAFRVAGFSLLFARHRGQHAGGLLPESVTSARD